MTDSEIMTLARACFGDDVVEIESGQLFFFARCLLARSPDAAALADEAEQHLLRANQEQGKRLAAEAEVERLKAELAATDIVARERDEFETALAVEQNAFRLLDESTTDQLIKWEERADRAEAELATLRERTIDECAKVCEQKTEAYIRKHTHGAMGQMMGIYEGTATECVDAIRALKDKLIAAAPSTDTGNPKGTGASAATPPDMVLVPREQLIRLQDLVNEVRCALFNRIRSERAFDFFSSKQEEALETINSMLAASEGERK
jgi:hypothetical protein